MSKKRILAVMIAVMMAVVMIPTGVFAANVDSSDSIVDVEEQDVPDVPNVPDVNSDAPDVDKEDSKEEDNKSGENIRGPKVDVEEPDASDISDIPDVPNVPDVDKEGTKEDTKEYESLEVEIGVKNDISNIAGEAQDMEFRYYMSKDWDSDLPMPNGRNIGFTGKGGGNFVVNFTEPISDKYEIWDSTYTGDFAREIDYYEIKVDVTEIPNTNKLQVEYTIKSFLNGKEISTTTASGVNPVCVFSYDKIEATSLPIKINKQVTNSSGKKGQFEFKIKDQTPRTKQKSILYVSMPDADFEQREEGSKDDDSKGITVTINGAGSKLSEPITFTEPGIYSFSITESDNPEYIKKTEGYVLDVYVMNEGTKMKITWEIRKVEGEDSSEIIAKGNDGDIPEVTFVNEEIPTSDSDEPTADDDGDKDDDGDNPEDDSQKEDKDKNTPNTGDENSMMLLMMIMLAASGAFTGTVLYRKNR